MKGLPFAHQEHVPYLLFISKYGFARPLQYCSNQKNIRLIKPFVRYHVIEVKYESDLTENRDSKADNGTKWTPWDIDQSTRQITYLEEGNQKHSNSNSILFQ